MAMKGPVWSLGSVSCAALDRVDAAMVLTDGVAVMELGPTASRPYTGAEQRVLHAARGRWPGEAGVTDAARVVEVAHAEVMSRLSGAQIAGFHGPTLAHDLAGQGTHQAGDGRLLAKALGLPVVWDLASADIRLGGQGGPLAPFYLHALARRIGADGPVAFLDLGAVARVTWADPSIAAPEAPGAVLAFDMGPGTALLADLARARHVPGPEAGGALALSGHAEGALVADFLADGYFLKMPPKWLGRAQLPRVLNSARTLSTADALRTLAACAAAAIARGAEHFPAPPRRWLASGAGRRNPALMTELSTRLSAPLAPVEEAGLDGDMIKAQAVAHLAMRVLRGLPTTCPTTTGVAAAVGGGMISRPSGAR
ncbi:MAG: anhydro-N-acetylmuramic acid kinase [Paracoccaceae bacterium]